VRIASRPLWASISRIKYRVAARWSDGVGRRPCSWRKVFRALGANPKPPRRKRLRKESFLRVLKGRAKIARGNAPGKRRPRGGQALTGRANGGLGRLASLTPTELVRGRSCVPGALPLAIFASPFRGAWEERRAILSGKATNVRNGTSSGIWTCTLVFLMSKPMLDLHAQDARAASLSS